jgi:hypothetical protein
MAHHYAVLVGYGTGRHKLPDPPKSWRQGCRLVEFVLLVGG